MAHTNATPNYSLPQFVGTDKPAWLTDFNGAMSAIDTAVKANEVSAATATASSAQNATAISAQATAISTLQTKVGALETAEPINEAQIATNTQNIATNAQNIVQIDNTLGHTSIAGIGDGKVTGAIADVNTRLSAIETPTGVSVTADGVKTYTQILNELCALIDSTKLNKNSALIDDDTGNVQARFMFKSSGEYTFGGSAGSGLNVITDAYILKTSGSTWVRAAFMSNSTLNVTDNSSAVPVSGSKLKVVY